MNKVIRTAVLRLRRGGFLLRGYIYISRESRAAPPKSVLVYQKNFKCQKKEDMGCFERGGGECTQGIEKEERQERAKASRSAKKGVDKRG